MGTPSVFFPLQGIFCRVGHRDSSDIACFCCRSRVTYRLDLAASRRLRVTCCEPRISLALTSAGAFYIASSESVPYPDNGRLTFRAHAQISASVASGPQWDRQCRHARDPALDYIRLRNGHQRRVAGPVGVPTERASRIQSGSRCGRCSRADGSFTDLFNEVPFTQIAPAACHLRVYVLDLCFDSLVDILPR